MKNKKKLHGVIFQNTVIFFECSLCKAIYELHLKQITKVALNGSFVVLFLNYCGNITHYCALSNTRDMQKEVIILGEIKS